MTKYERDLRRIERKPLEIEEIRWQRTSVNQLPPAIFQCKNLKVLSIDRCRLELLHEEIGQLESLEELVIDTNKVKTLPKALLDLKKLKRVSITSNEITEFPVALMAHPTLEILDLKLNKIAIIPDFTVKNTALKMLSVSNDELKFVSASLVNLRALERLELAYGKLTTLPIALGELTNLSYLDFRWNPVETLPECLKSLDKLSILTLAKTGIVALPDWIAEKQMLQEINFGYGTGDSQFSTFPKQLIHTVRTAKIVGLEFIYPLLTGKDSQQLWKQIKAQNGTAEDDLRYIHLFTGDDRIATHPKEKIFADLKKTKDIFVAQNAIQFFTKDSLKNNPLTAGSEIALLGKLDLKDLRILKQRIKKADIALEKKPTENTTHLYISQKIEGDYASAFRHLPFINSEQLLRHLDEAVPQYLMEDKENLVQNADNIRRFLFSIEETSQLLAFELIKSGGLPKELLTDVFYLFQTTDNAKIRTKARNLVKKYASPKLLTGLKVRQKIKDIYQDRFKFTNFWKQAVAETELDDLKLLLYMVRDYGTQITAMNLLLEHQESNDEEIIKYVAKNGQLQLRGDEQSRLIKVLPTVSHLTELELWNMKFDEFPTAIFELKSLQTLFFREVNIAEIPEKITELSQLKVLKLNHLGVEKLPNLAKLNVQELDLTCRFAGDLSPVLKNMKSLKKLHILGRLESSQLPSALKSCENIEVLSLHGSNPDTFVDAIIGLQQLRELELKYIKLTEFPTLLTKLPNLRKIKVQGNSETYLLLKEHQHLFHPQLVLE